ncbi:MAG: septum formation initiator family protein [Ignavibacteriae bacterium]|nr:septum formation initiator family protein [Ignavibacteriota bacterium]NOG97310.1 septum formation initiator family protein [Ignavibacteriota bacterium]
MKNFEIPSRAKFYIYLITALIVAAFIAFNSDGLLKYFSLNSQISEIEEQIKVVETKLDSLKREIELLKNDNIKIEKVAREKFNMHKPDEIPIRVEKVTPGEDEKK